MRAHPHVPCAAHHLHARFPVQGVKWTDDTEEINEYSGKRKSKSEPRSFLAGRAEKHVLSLIGGAVCTSVHARMSCSPSPSLPAVSVRCARVASGPAAPARPPLCPGADRHCRAVTVLTQPKPSLAASAATACTLPLRLLPQSAASSTSGGRSASGATATATTTARSAGSLLLPPLGARRARRRRQTGKVLPALDGGGAGAVHG